MADESPKNLDDLFKDPDFQQSSIETQRWAAGKLDKTFSESDAATQTKLLEGYNKKQQQMDRVVPQAQESVGRSMFNQARDKATRYVGDMLEQATVPAVIGARLAQGEGRQAFGPESYTATAPKSAQDAASYIVPQKPWQAALLAAGPVGRGLGAAVPAAAKLAGSGLGRMLMAGGLGAGAEAATGGNPVGGAAAAGTAAGVGNAIPSMTSFMRRHIGRGAQNVADKEATGVAQAVAGVSPTFQGAIQPQGSLSRLMGGGAKGQSQRLGEFATHEAPKAAHGVFEDAMGRLDTELAARGIRLNTPELAAAQKIAIRTLNRDPVINAQQIADLTSAKGGWDADQTAKILTAYRESKVGRSIGDPTLAKRQAMEGVSTILKSIEASLPKDLQGILTGARQGYARDMGLSEMLSGGMKTGPRGYLPDMKALQQALSDPETARRLTPEQLSSLRNVFTRGATKGPGYSDMGARGVPLIPASPTGLKFGLLRQLLTGGHTYTGQKPFTAAPGTKQAVGYAAGQATNRRSQEE